MAVPPPPPPPGSKISDEKEKSENLLFKNGPARTTITSLSVVSALSILKFKKLVNQPFSKSQ